MYHISRNTSYEFIRDSESYIAITLGLGQLPINEVVVVERRKDEKDTCLVKGTGSNWISLVDFDF